MPNKSILFISFFPDILGGGEIHTYSLALFLSNFYDIYIYHFHNDFFLSKIIERCKVKFKSSNIFWIRASSKDTVRYFFELYKLAKDVDLIIFPKATLGHKSIFLEFFIKEILRKKLITIEHSVPFPYPPPKRIKGIPIIGYSRFKKIISYDLRSFFPDRIVCVSKFVKNILCNCYNFSTNKTVVIYNGVDLDLFRFSIVYRERLRKKYGICDEDLVYGVIARLANDKRIDRLLRAVGRVLFEVNKNMFIFIIGDGPQKYYLRSLTDDLGLREKVFFIEKTLCPWKYYSMFDFFVLPSDSEALGLSLLEAMSCGCVPIATNVGGVKEVLNSSPFGWLVDPSVSSLSMAIHDSLFFYPSMNRIDVCRKMREYLEKNFSIKRQFQKYLSLIETLF